MVTDTFLRGHLRAWIERSAPVGSERFDDVEVAMLAAIEDDPALADLGWPAVFESLGDPCPTCGREYPVAPQPADDDGNLVSCAACRAECEPRS